MSKDGSSIICLFTIDSQYDQPEHNLSHYWREMPSFETMLQAIGGDMSKTDHVVACANLLQGHRVNLHLHNTTYYLMTVYEGKDSEHWKEAKFKA